MGRHLISIAVIAEADAGDLPLYTGMSPDSIARILPPKRALNLEKTIRSVMGVE